MATRRTTPAKASAYLAVSLILTLFGFARLALEIRRGPAKPARRA